MTPAREPGKIAGIYREPAVNGEKQHRRLRVPPGLSLTSLVTAGKCLGLAREQRTARLGKKPPSECKTLTKS